MKSLVGIFLFLAVLILCTLFARSIHQDHIDRDLRGKVAAILTEKGLAPSGIELNHHHLTQIGELPATEAASKELRDELDGVIGLYLDLDLTPPRVLSPPNFHLAEQSDQSVILTGLVKNDDERKFLVDLAATPATEGGPSRKVIDQLEISDDVTEIAPTDKLSALAPTLLSTADRAFINWCPSELTIGGMLEEPAQKSALVTAASEVVAEGTEPLSELKVQPPQDLDFGLKRKDGSIVVTGLLPDKATRDNLLQMVNREARGSRVLDKTTLALRPNQRWWAKSPGKFIPHFLSTTTGNAKVHYYPDRFVAECIFKERSDYEIIKAQIAAFPQTTQLETSLRIIKKPPPKPNPAAAANLEKELKNLAVYFDSSSSTVKEAGDEKIDAAARLILSSKNVIEGLTVGGYADLRGNASYNRKLSLQRANAVRDRLIAKGVPAARLTVNHFGEDTSKTSKGDLWKSRRVEISLTKPTNE